MKEKLNELRKSIKAKLDEAAKAITDGKLPEAKAFQAEAAALKEQADLVKTQVEAESTLELDALKTRNAELEAKAKEPVRPPFDEAVDEQTKSDTDTIKSLYLMKYGEPDVAVKAVIADL